ncbi:MAG TPA: APC family permease [Acidimicrobiia bacterium]|nr:APC family permease [Acidimicrobiia bacterium]
MAESMAPAGEMKRSLTLTGVTVNAMALIAPGAFLWTTFQSQSALQRGGTSTAPEMWTGLLFALILALLTAYSYSELSRIYPDAGTGSSYYFAEAALLTKASPKHRSWARFAKLSVGWISHLYYWIYPGIMVAFTATLFGYIYASVFSHQLSYLPLAVVAVLFAVITGYIAFRGISGSTMTSIAILVIQTISLIGVSIWFIAYRLGHSHQVFEHTSASTIIIPHSFISLLYQSTIAILLLVGFESITALGAEALRPEKDIKRGVLISLLIQGGFCYLLQYFAANYAAGPHTLGAAKGTTGYNAAGADSAPIGTMLKQTISHGGTAVSVLVAVTVLIALIGTTLACLNTGVRVTYAMAKDKEMPSILGLLHGEFATPHMGIWILVAVSAALGVFGANPKQVDNLTQITLASNTGTFLVYGLTCIIAIVAFASRHDRHTLKHYLVPGLGALMNIAELLGVVYIATNGSGTSPGDAYKALGIVIVWCVLGFVWVALNPAGRHARDSHRQRAAEQMKIPV